MKVSVCMYPYICIYVCMYEIHDMIYSWSQVSLKYPRMNWWTPGKELFVTSSNGNIFRLTGHLCGNSPVPGEFPAQRPVTRSFDVFFDLRLNKWLSKQSWGWWSETLSYPLWRHRNVIDCNWLSGVIWIGRLRWCNYSLPRILVNMRSMHFGYRRLGCPDAVQR